MIERSLEERERDLERERDEWRDRQAEVQKIERSKERER